MCHNNQCCIDQQKSKLPWTFVLVYNNISINFVLSMFEYFSQIIVLCCRSLPIWFWLLKTFRFDFFYNLKFSHALAAGMTKNGFSIDMILQKKLRQIRKLISNKQPPTSKHLFFKVKKIKWKSQISNLKKIFNVDWINFTICLSKICLSSLLFDSCTLYKFRSMVGPAPGLSI